MMHVKRKTPYPWRAGLVFFHGCCADDRSADRALPALIAQQHR
jgi:hypothetical protein